MAYNMSMYQPYGQAYGNYPNSYGQSMAQTPVAQPSYAPAMVKGEIEWVDGEVGAKAYQIPQGQTKPVALWDTNDTVIYLKSMNPMGMPNPLQKIHYTMEETAQRPAMGNTALLGSGDAAPDMTGYVRREELDEMRRESVQKTDLEAMKREILDSIGQATASGTARRGVRGE